MTSATLADWTTPQPFALPDLGPGLDAERREAVEAALQTISADPTVQALVIFGSRARGNARPESDLVRWWWSARRTWRGRRRWPAGGAISNR
ncbi:nucleotidyltransferase domain-containing protein [Cyanobium sp. FGCU-6]|nr:nucleotidyltransferase domain-containing protein [Cyanobium sp. FGCU6]